MPLPLLLPTLIGGVIDSAADQAPPMPMTLEVPAGIVRTLPASAAFGEMAPPQFSSVQINGQLLLLSPAAQFRNEMNMVVPPTTIERTVPVRYLTDFTGAVWRVWILTPAEVAVSR